jgi:predicted transposase YdaD
MKRIRDEQAVFAQKLDDAKQEGRQEGIQISKGQGIIKVGAEKVAKNLLKAGVSIDVISISEIKKI